MISSTQLITSKDLSNVIGSWHPRGYHGHSRAKSRIEYSNYYRQSAKPVPPEKFRARQRDDALKHVFSHHDNKQAFLNDSTLFGSGLGKKKIESVNKSQWNPEFIAWSEACGRDRLHRSIYQKDFCDYAPGATIYSVGGITGNLASNGSSGSNYVSKLLPSRQSIDTRLASMYSTNFEHGEPTSQTSIETRRDTFCRFVSKNRAKSCAGERLSVANCMVWHNSSGAPRTAHATQDTQTQQTAHMADSNYTQLESSA